MSGVPDRELSSAPADPLRHHGDQDLGPGLVDLAVNVRRAPRPGWLTAALEEGLRDLAGYPDPAKATAAVAARHGRPPAEVLLTAGAAEAFVLLARALRPVRAVAVHPSFTEPEAALRAAGHPIDRAVAAPPFAVLPDVPHDADLVVLGNPTNPTGVLHPAQEVAALARAGRTLVVDEAFMDFVPGEPASLAGRPDLPGLVVVRSLTKMYGLAGLRVGYLLAAAPLVAALREQQPLWSVSAPALAVAAGCMSEPARREAGEAAVQTAARRVALAGLLSALPGVEVSPGAAANFLLVHVVRGRVVRESLRRKGFAVRRGDTFPGLGEDWLRVAVPDEGTAARFAAALGEVMSAS
jgi:histidinol-phosphate aminotransferase